MASSAGQASFVALGPDRYEALARTHYENFPVASLLVPRAVRRHLRLIYAFARTADDLADEQRDPLVLRAFRDSFAAQLHGTVGDSVPLLRDLVVTIERFALPRELFFDLLDAFAQDLVVHRYDERGLFDYCRKSANPVGRLVLRLFGHDEPRLDVLSDRICTGLQLLNHLQDIRADLCERDRIYFPVADLARFSVSEDDLRSPSAKPAVRALVAHWTDRTAALLREGAPLAAAVRGRLRFELRAILESAHAAVRRIRAVDHDVLGSRVRLSRIARAAALARALVRRNPGR
jgi:squalene synthase HpnC